MINNAWNLQTLQNGNQIYGSKGNGGIFMLPSDLGLLSQPSTAGWVTTYANSNAAFTADFARAYARLLAQGFEAQPCPAPICWGVEIFLATNTGVKHKHDFVGLWNSGVGGCVSASEWLDSDNFFASCVMARLTKDRIGSQLVVWCITYCCCALVNCRAVALFYWLFKYSWYRCNFHMGISIFGSVIYTFGYIWELAQPFITWWWSTSSHVLMMTDREG